MTKTTKKRINNLNLFLLVIALGFFMYWNKQHKMQSNNEILFSKTIPSQSINPIQKVVSKK